FTDTLLREVAVTAAKVGWEPKDFSLLAKSEEKMKLILGMLRGTHQIKNTKGAIDCDEAPHVPYDLTIEDHQKCGVIKFSFSKVKRYLSNKQKEGTISFKNLRQELSGKKILNANVLDYLLANQERIPADWREGRIFFLGTTYRDSSGGRFVDYIYWGTHGWYRRNYRVSLGFSSLDFIALFED
ncbi:MAG: hypothetical protein AAB895_01060, partial [Patescibacteria group bacterium]